MICTISESNKSMRRLAPNKITMAERQIRMSLCYLRFALLMTVTHSVGGDSLLDTLTQRPLNLTMVNFIGLYQLPKNSS